jgi:hypothetical protein
MKNIHPKIGILFLLWFSACANQGPPIQTASGRPEVFISGVPPQRVRATIIDRAVGRGWTLERETDNGIAFTKPTDNMMASILLGSTYDPNVIDRVRFTTVAMNGGTKIYVSEEFVTNHGSAFEKVTPLQNNANSRNLQAMLERLKADVGTKASKSSTSTKTTASPSPKASPATSPTQQPE